MNPGPADVVLASPTAQPPTDVWSNLDMAAIESSLNQTGVWAPADQQPALKNLVQQAHADGHELHVVILDQAYPKFTAYRDIATQLQSSVGGTVLVFGPSGSGTASSEFSRVQLEDASSDVTKGSTATEAATQIYHHAIDPNVDWTGVTIGLVVVVVLGAVVARLRMKRRAAVTTPVDAAPAVDDDGQTPLG
ncbi:DUF6676 family protein [Gordonia sp. (in: high G+C Gram-positive bacteria)]|uniref:Rv1476 family membrane protein n=1 Tax=Gordonia sp. (in: high G+C Gram-positive bacteria) TaxID=84139 RepID=UPI003C7626A7